MSKNNSLMSNQIVCPYCYGEEFLLLNGRKDKTIIMCSHCGRSPYKAHQIRRWK